MSLMGLPNTIKSLPLHWKKIKARSLVLVWGLFYRVLTSLRVSQVALVVKNPSANAEGIRAVGSIPGLARCPGGGHDNPLQYSCLENPIDRGAWWATVHGAAKCQKQLKRFNMQACTHTTSLKLVAPYPAHMEPTTAEA